MTTKKGRLAGKIIHVTGAGGKIGHALVEMIKAEGGLPLSSDHLHHGVELALDVTVEEEWKATAQWIESQHGAIDGLVNGAGIGRLGSIDELSFDDWRSTHAVNLDGVFLGCKYMMPLMRERGGSIVNLSSIAGIVAAANFAAYNSSKAAVRHLSKSVALHGARMKPPVRCNSVHPAFIESAMVDAMIAGTSDPDRARAKMMADIPLGRFGEAKEVASLCVYLLSDESSFVTGSEFIIDGGLSAK
ncbi:SDR family oxidoreductase [Terrarubrum flagellatum]|uniref:SDR family oxidoreductase n=1 Tax=Terrirubrum flagellatum TaxID=2895980 RepID=UPI003144EB2D